MGSAAIRFPEFFALPRPAKLSDSADIHRILRDSNLNEAETTARALLTLGGTEDEYMLNPNYERRKRELENVANVLTDDVVTAH